MTRDDKRGLGGLDPSGVAHLSLKSKNYKNKTGDVTKRKGIIN